MLEQWATGALMSFELAGAFERGYDAAMPHSFPPFPQGMGQRYFDAGLAYFAHFEGFGAQYSVLAAEQRFDLDLQGHPFTGVIDLVMEDTASGGLVVMDHKSKSAKGMHAQLDASARQLYLYAAAVYARYGRYPARLQFNLFRDGVGIDLPFDPAQLHSTQRWVRDTIQVIQAETNWPARPSVYFCRFLCGSFAHCPHQR